jgi:hypothetical protein
METRTRGQRATEQMTHTDWHQAAEAAKNKNKVYPDDQLRRNVSVNQMLRAMYPPELKAPPPASPSQASPSGSSRLGARAGSPSGSPRGKPRRPTRHCRQSAERRYWHYGHVQSIQPADRLEPSPGYSYTITAPKRRDRIPPRPSSQVEVEFSLEYWILFGIPRPYNDPGGFLINGFL